MKDRKLHLTPDRGLLTAKSTVFPVYIDPAYVPHPASGSRLHWNEVQQAYPNTSNYDSSPSNGNGVGYQGFSSPKGIERTYYQVGIPTAIWGGTVLSADMKMTESYSASCATTSYGVQAWSTNPISASTTWANAPGKVAQQSSVNFGPACSSSPSGTFSFMNQVTNAAANHWSNVTFVLVNSSETNEVQFKRFSSAASLSITYNTPPTTPTSLAASPTATDGYAASATPTLSAKATDANSDTVRLDYQVLSGTTVKASGSSAFVNSGSAGTWKVSTALTDGSYTWKVRAYDGRDYSAWTAAKSLIIDTKAPANTSVSSTDFPSNVWSGTPDATGNFSGAFTFTPPTSDVAQVVWQLDSGASNTTATTGATFTKSLTFRAGKHTLTAKTHDRAGNVASGTSYAFYAGSGAALLTPGQGDRPARRVSLTAEGKPSATGVTYQYRIGETDTWRNVPTANVTVGSSGAPVTSWPFAAPGGAPAALTWNITDTLAQDGPVDLRAVFTDGTLSDNSPPSTVTVDRNVGSAPSVDVGPGSVNALTGDYGVGAQDVSAFGQVFSRTLSSRQPTAGSDAEGQTPILGPQWVSGVAAPASDWDYVRQTSATSVAVVDSSGIATGFTATSAGGWKPEPGAEKLILTGSLTGSFKLTDGQGATTTFAKVDPSAKTWQMATSYLATSDSTSTVVSEKVAVGGKTLARPKYLVAPTSAVTAATCASTPATKGCRLVEFVYATSTTATSTSLGDFAGQLREVRLWSTGPGAAAATSKSAQMYQYDSTGYLRQTWNPQVTPSLFTKYSYDASGRLATLTPPGELPWTFTYGKAGNAATAGSGMLLAASRPTLQAGSQDQPDGGKAVTSLVYDVPLTGSTAPLAMGASTVATWGQTDVPTDATAVFPADQVPASHDGASLSSGSYARASLTYTDASGREVNDAAPGGHLTTTEYDHLGNPVRELSASNRELALATSGAGFDELTALGISEMSPADRAGRLSTVHVYAVDGGRELEEYGPLHHATLTGVLKAGAGGTDLPAGSQVAVRRHTLTAYDEDRPTDGSATVSDLPTTVTTGAYVDSYPADADVRVTATRYDWTKGLPTSTIQDPDGQKITTSTTYDTQGRAIKAIQPRSNGSDASTTVTTYYSASGSGACNGRPEWADMVCSIGPAAAITGGGTNPTQRPTKTLEYDWAGQVTKTTETANGVTRTTTSTYDSAERPVRVSVTGGVGTAVADIATTYDTTTGRPIATTSGSKTVTRTYDTLGRAITYDDGMGNTTRTTYDALDRPLQMADSAPSTTTFAYDTSKDPRGIETSRTDSVAGTFSADYNADGDLTTEHLPGGYTMTVTHDETQAPVAKLYTRDSDGTVVASDTVEQSAQGQTVVHNGTDGDTAAQQYAYDSVGRLIGTDDNSSDGTCTRRTYGFDADSNRIRLAVSNSAPGDPCSSSGAVSTSATYDSSDRLSTAGTAYDAFGRTTAQATGVTFDYYTTDLIHQETTASARQTWSLDSGGRLASWTTETKNTDGTWSTTTTTTSHYAGDGDSPAWVVQGADGTVTRSVEGLDGGLEATTGATGATTLQLTTLHGDISVQLPLDALQPVTVSRTDEYGNPKVDSVTSRYGWLGRYQRAYDNADGNIVMGMRVYSPVQGRFLSADPVAGGSCNPYEYGCGDPVNNIDASGTACRYYNKTYYIREGSVRAKIAEFKLHAEVCTGSRNRITSSVLNADVYQYGWTNMLGWHVSLGWPYATAKTAYHAAWRVDAWAQACMTKFIPICGYTERFKFTLNYYTTYYGPYPSNYFRPNWKAGCTNSRCRLRFATS
ncbi:hypothetical protein BGM09_28305 [Streptomyces sp. CBMA29]|nr:hypothetical protein [Streptomyces sp. CBMA29]